MRENKTNAPAIVFLLSYILNSALHWSTMFFDVMQVKKLEVSQLGSDMLTFEADNIYFRYALIISLDWSK